MREIERKKTWSKVLAFFLVCCFLVNIVGAFPFEVQAVDTSVFFGSDGDEGILREDVANGVKATYKADVTGYIKSIFTYVYDIRNGLHIEVENISFPADKGYSFVISFTKNAGASKPGGWAQSDGQMLVYGSDGKCVIFDTASGQLPDGTYNPKYQGQFEQFSVNETTGYVDGSLTLDIKRVGENFEIRVNNNEPIEIKANSSVTEETYLGPRFGLLGSIDNEYIVDYDAIVAKGTSFVVAKVSEEVPVTGMSLDCAEVYMMEEETKSLNATVSPENATNQDVIWNSSDESVVTVNADGVLTAVQAGNATITAASVEDSAISARCKVTVFGDAVYDVPDEVKVTQDNNSPHWMFQETEQKIRFTHKAEGAGWERIFVKQVFYPNYYDIHMEMKDICSESDNYSLAIAFGSESGQWYDKAGYMLLYGKSGNFAIIATDSTLVTKVKEAPVVASDVREELGTTLSLNIRLEGEQYEITVNGITYTIPAKHELYPVSNSKKLHVAFGVMGNLTLDTSATPNRISSLNYDGVVGGRADVSFVIDKKDFNLNSDSLKIQKPFADYTAFMTGYPDGTFRPEQAMTRQEAIVAMAKLLVDADDIQGVYTSDFTDISEEATEHDYIAYMERCGFLPDYGTELKPNQGITYKELAELFWGTGEVPEGFVVDDVNTVVTRGAAAKAFCEYIGKTTSISEPKITFTDVTKDTEYADYIWLATNEMDVFEKTYTVTSEGDKSIQDCINEAIELSKTKDTKVTIELTDSIYYLTEPVIIDGSTYGEYELVIVIKNAEDVSPIISGNVDVAASKFTKVSGEEYYSYEIPDSAKVEGNWPQFRDLYLNGERLQLARSQEHKFTKTLDTTTDDGGKSVYVNGFYVDSTIFENISETALSPLELCINIEWMHKRFRVDAIQAMDEEAGLTNVSVCDEEWHAYTYYDGNKTSFETWPYWFENHLSLLDEPGEFYYDDTNGVIYFYPYKDTDTSKAVVSYPAVEKLFDIKHASGIVFEGVTFTGTTSNFTTEHGFNGSLGGVHGWNDSTEKTLGENRFYQNEDENPFDGIDSEYIHAAAIYANDANHISVRNCSFDELGTNGIYMNGGNHNVVMKGSSFTDIAMSGVVLGKHSTIWSLEYGQSNIIIDNNYVYNIGTDYPLSPGLNVSYVKNIAVTHNDIIHTPYSGIIMGWMNTPNKIVSVHHAEVAYNHCEDNLYALNDGSALYFCGANALKDNATIYNRVHDNYIKSNGYTKTYNGIYLDMNASNYSVYNNVIDGIRTSHGPIYNQNITEQVTYNNLIQENYTTMSSITTTAVAERNIQLINNEKVAAYDKLPVEALSIIEAAGQKGEFAAYRPVDDTVVVMKVENPHINLRKSEYSESASVVFEITNNTDKTGIYSIERTNEGKIQFVPSVSSLQLKAGETGVIMAAFYSAEEVTGGELVDLVVVKDNGWKQVYKRVIDVSVGVTANGVGDKITFSQNENGLVVAGGRNTTHAERIPIYKVFSLAGDGVEIELTNISSQKPLLGSKDTDYSVAIKLGAYNTWYDAAGVMIIYGKSGAFSVVATEDGASSPNNAQVLLTDTREALQDGDGISIHVREDEHAYMLMLNGKTYELPSEYFANMDSLYLTFGIMGDKTNQNDTYEKTIGFLQSITFTIAALSCNRPGDVVFDYTDTFSNYRPTTEGATMKMPDGEAGYIFAGWYYDWSCTQAIPSEIRALNAGEKAYAKFVDKDVLSVQVQSKYTEGTNQSKMDWRMVTSVDSLNYQNVGFRITANGQTRSYSSTTAYTRLNAAGIEYRPQERFSSCSKSFITIKLVNIGLSNPSNEITVQPFWTTLDGTIVDGWPRTITIQEGIEAMAG